MDLGKKIEVENRSFFSFYEYFNRIKDVKYK